ncbi:dynein intermediate chain 4, axonemal [Cyprinodon tularosa]|uniref:dynein intermediate chain 4, axonemal n=1 Tax=Cyprinodon tularosa TaxID=77115 RepID=UPI0018E2613C|nr:dynein intermediate chain 4, axonemal [Cyprinodon tularosa]
MSTSEAKEEKKRRCTVMLRPSLLRSFSRPTSIQDNNKVVDQTADPTPGQADWVFDEENSEVMAQSRHQADNGTEQTNKFMLDELFAGSASDQTTFTESSTLPISRSPLDSSRTSSQPKKEFVNEEMEEMFSKYDLPISFQEEKLKKDLVKEQVTQAMLKEILITDTDCVSLLDIPPNVVSVDSDGADIITERNKQYAEACGKRFKIDNYVDRVMQTLNRAAKNKCTQMDLMLKTDAAVDMHEYPEQEVMIGSLEEKQTSYSEAGEEFSRSAERSMSLNTSARTDVEAVGTSLNTKLDWELIKTSEKFHYLLVITERIVLRSILHCPLAAYRGLPLLGDPDRPGKPEEMDQSKRCTEISCSPALECLWVFSCELTRGRTVSCMAWDKNNPDLLAVGYSETDSMNQKPGLVCCWCIINPTWPERIIYCDGAITTLDFSANHPGRLAVGMSDGVIAIYNLQTADIKAPTFSSWESLKRHRGPVRLLRWNLQEQSFTEKERVENLFSLGEDGRTCKWFVVNGCLECTDLMELNRINTPEMDKQNQPETEEGYLLPMFTSGLYFDFHPTDANIYLTCTLEGNIQKRSCSRIYDLLENYRKHFGPVNCVTWCPFHPDVFLSCSSDSTIKLWKQDCKSPMLSFTSNHRAVHEVRWSPRQAAVFGAVNDSQLEIWDLNTNFLNPVIVQRAAPGLKMTSLLFASLSDCVMVGDSCGQVTVYKLQNIFTGESSQGEVLDALCSAASKESRSW